MVINTYIILGLGLVLLGVAAFVLYRWASLQQRKSTEIILPFPKYQPAWLDFFVKLESWSGSSLLISSGPIFPISLLFQWEGKKSHYSLKKAKQISLLFKNKRVGHWQQDGDVNKIPIKEIWDRVKAYSDLYYLERCYNSDSSRSMYASDEDYKFAKQLAFERWKELREKLRKERKTARKNDKKPQKN